MICFSTAFLRLRRSGRIPLRMPSDVVIFTGCEEERIDAVVGRDRRVARLVIRTRQQSISSSDRRF